MPNALYPDGTAIVVGQPCNFTSRESVLTAVLAAHGPRNLYAVCVESNGKYSQGSGGLVLWASWADPVLQEFVILCTEAMWSRSRHVDPLEWAVVQAKKGWLNGEVTDDDYFDATTAFDLDERDLRGLVAEYATATASTLVRTVDPNGGRYHMASGGYLTVKSSHYLEGATAVWNNDFSLRGPEQALASLINTLRPGATL